MWTRKDTSSIKVSELSQFAHNESVPPNFFTPENVHHKELFFPTIFSFTWWICLKYVHYSTTWSVGYNTLCSTNPFSNYIVFHYFTVPYLTFNYGILVAQLEFLSFFLLLPYPRKKFIKLKEVYNTVTIFKIM